MCCIGEIYKIIRCHSCLSIRVAASKNTIPKEMSFVNKIMISGVERWEKLGVTKAMANQAADKFTNTADNIFRNAKWVLVTKIF